MKKTISMLLLCAMLTSLAACGNGATSETESQTPAAESETVTDTVETEPMPELPQRDFEGYTYRILSTEVTNKFICAAESTGEVVNDAVYASNAAVGEQFNITFTTIPITSNSDATIIQSYIMAGEDAYDVAQLHDCTSGSMALNGWFHNVYEIPYVDTTKPWWPQFTVDSLTLNGKMYVISNYTTYRAMHETRVAFFNRDMIEDLAMESPYDLVREGTWTIDKLASMTKDVYVDVNGDGKQDKGDTMGFTFTSAPYCWLESFGVETYQKVSPDSAEMVLNANTEEVVNLVDKLYNWLCQKDSSIWCKMGNAREEAMEMFASGSCLFTFKCIGDQLPYLMETDMNYGIVPFPKLEESVQDYVSACTDLLLTIPVTAGDMERTGMITEAMSYYGWKLILPAYCETALKNRYSTDKESAEMLDLIFQNRTISFAYLFVNMGPGMQLRLLIDTIGKNKSDVASYYAKNEQKELSVMEKVTAFYGDGTTAK